MTVEFDNRFFGTNDGQTDIFDANLNAQFIDGKYIVKCGLGECDMVGSMSDDESNIIFTLSLGTKDSHNKVTVNDDDVSFSVYTGATEVSVNVKCEYASNIDIASDSFSVSAAAAGAHLNQIGDLARGFHLNLYGDENLSTALSSEVFVGQQVWAVIEWTVETVKSQLNFYLNSCEIDLGSASASIVDGNCYSSALGVSKLGTPNEWIVSDSTGFTFKSFSSNPTSAGSQTVTVKCNVQLCLLSQNKCKINKVDAECPRQGSGYQFTPNGVHQAAAAAVQGAYKSFECDGTHCVLTTWEDTVFTGLDRGDVVDFRGIKYALSPSGALRWKSPVLRTYGAENVDATEWDNMCACHRCYSPQQEISQEDCLSVNIAVKKDALMNEEGVPILYYYHGGGGNHGHSRYDAYDMVMDQNMMVISVGYRLGMFSYMYLPEIEEGQDSQCNFGIQDQVMAMRFSQKYGKIMGGNPSEAVISGSSSAGEAMWWLLTIPEAWPYFNKANVMCMGLNNANTPETASIARDTVLKVMGCETIDCLRQYSRVEIRDAANIAAGTARHGSTKLTLEPGFAPVVDGRYLRDHLYTLVSNGDFKPHTPISFSYNDHDQWEFNHLSIFTLKNKFLKDVMEDMNKIGRHIQVPSNYSDMLLERYFGEEQATGLKEVFGCSSETVIECNVAFDRFLTSYGWSCNTRSALENLKVMSII